LYHVSLTPLSSRGNEMKNRGIRAGTGYGSPAGIGEVRFSRVTRTDRVHMLYSCPQMPGGSSYCRSGISLRRGSPPCQSGPFTAPDCPSRSPKSGISCKNAPFSCTVFRKSVHCPDLWQSACFTRYFLNINRQFPEAKVGCMWRTAWLMKGRAVLRTEVFLLQPRISLRYTTERSLVKERRFPDHQSPTVRCLSGPRPALPDPGNSEIRVQ
jgi:hypothetical protein